MNAPTTRRRDLKARPQFDSLEGRQLLAAQFGFNAGILTITSTTNTVELVSITDNGSGGGGNVKVESRATKNGRADTFTPSGQVKEIVVDLGPGNDSLSYVATNGIAVSQSRKLTIRGGTGKDTVSLTLGRPFIPNLPPSVALGTNASLTADIDLGAGNDTFAAVLFSRLDSGSNLKINARGGADQDSLAFVTALPSDVASTAAIDLALDGEAGDDTVTATYSGALKGTLFLNLKGGAGNETGSSRKVSAKVNLSSGSTGKVGTAERRARVDGGTGNDKLIFRIQAAPGTSALVAADIDGGTGTNSAERTANVVPLNIQSDAVVA